MAWEAGIYNHRAVVEGNESVLLFRKRPVMCFVPPFALATGPTWGQQSEDEDEDEDGAFCWASNMKAPANNRHRRSVWTRSGSQPREDETPDTFISIKDGRSLGSIGWMIQPPSGSQVAPEQTGCWGGGSARFPGCYFTLLVQEFIAFVRIKQTF